MSRIIKDCIYGHIEVPKTCWPFIDAPEFQRLRRIKQLGMVHYVYPSAVHTRFEHSLGVMHLAGKIVDHLGKKYFEFSEREKVLIQLAGLYHDIGHFSYSHLFDDFLKEFKNKDELPEIFRLENHEQRSCFFLKQVNSRIKSLTYDEEQFVCNVITGSYDENTPYKFLYEIICNRECGIDVDKMDYLRRDSFHTGFPGFQSDYIIHNSILDDEFSLSFAKKTYNDIDDLFRTRHRMFENVYQHHTSQKIDKIYFCMMRRVGTMLFMYGENTDDYNIETLLRNSEETKDLIGLIDNRYLDHNCPICEDYKVGKKVKSSGSIDKVRFI